MHRRGWTAAGWVVGIAAGLSVLAAGPALGQQKDYSAGFKKFYSLGLPDVQKGTWVKLDAYGGDFHSSMSDMYMYEVKLSGNAWMLDESKSNASHFVVGSTRLVSVYDQDFLMEQRKKKMKEEAEKNKGKKGTPIVNRWGMDEGDTRIGGKWKKADLQKDIEKTLAYLKKERDKDERHSSFRYSNSAGSLFLAAIHWHRQGHTNEANEMVGLLFELGQDPRKVITQGLNTLADSQYQAAYETFSKEGNWQAFSADLDSLLARFPAGWQKAPAIKMLSDRVKERIAKPTPPPVAGEGITPEDVELAAKMAHMPDSPRAIYYGYGGELWILPGARRRYGPMAKTDKDKEDVMAQIRKRGLKSIPLLLALVKDDYLTRTSLGRIRGVSFGNNFYSSDDEMKEEMVKRMYQSLPRPASRADIAVQLLTPLLIRSEDRRYRGNEEGDMRDEILEEGRQWYKANKDKSVKDLARMYLKDGDESQQMAALTYLMRSTNDADLAVVETHFLAEPSDKQDRGMNMNFHLVQQYVMVRGEKAKAFMEKYEAQLRKKMAAADNEMFKDDNYKKMIEQSLAQMKTVFSKRSVKDILADITSGKKTWEESGNEFQQRLFTEKPEAALTMLLEAALAAKDVKLTRNLLSMAASVRYAGRDYGRNMMMGMDEMDEEDGDEAAVPGMEKPAALDIGKHAELWKKLLADTRSLGEEENVYSVGMEKMTIGDTAAWMIDSLYGKGTDPAEAMDEMFEGRDYQVLGIRVQKLIRARAEALLAGKKGKDLPAMPSADNVTKEQAKKMVDKLLAAPDAGLAAAIAGLSLDEHLALMKETADNEKLNEKLVREAHKITGVSGKSGPVDLAAQLGGEKGKLLAKPVVEKLLEICKRLTGEGKRVFCTASRKPCLDGIELSLREMPAAHRGNPEYDPFGGREEGRKAMVQGQVYGGEESGSAIWSLEEPAKDKKAPEKKKPASTGNDALDELVGDAMDELEVEMDSSSGVQQEEFWKQVEEFCKGKGNVCGYGVVQFIGMPEVKKDPAKAKPAAAKRAAAEARAAEMEKSGVSPAAGTTVEKTVTTTDGGKTTVTVEKVTSKAGTVETRKIEVKGK